MIAWTFFWLPHPMHECSDLREELHIGGGLGFSFCLSHYTHEFSDFQEGLMTC